MQKKSKKAQRKFKSEPVLHEKLETEIAGWKS